MSAKLAERGEHTVVFIMPISVVYVMRITNALHCLCCTAT